MFTHLLIVFQQRYKAFLQNLAAVNRTLAIMTPHGMFASAVLVFECFFFSIGRWLVEQTPLTSMLSTVKPLVWTVLLAFDMWNDRHLEETNRQKRGMKSSKRSRRSLAGEFQPKHLHVHADDLLRYWVVRGSLAALKKSYLLFPFSSTFIRSHTLIISLLCKLEFWFWVWVNVGPYLAPTSLGGEKLPDPLKWLVEHMMKPTVLNLQQGLSLDFPQVNAFWENTVMVAVPACLKSLTWISFLKTETAEFLLHLTAQGRSFVAPFLLVLIYPLRGFGVLSVSYLLPVAGSLTAEMTALDESSRTEEHWLQTWVLHVILSGMLELFAPLLWWMPGYNLGTFFAYVLLSISPPTTMARFYLSYVQEELQVWHILPPGEVDRESYIGNFVVWVIEKLPKAEGVEPINGRPGNANENAEVSEAVSRREGLRDANGLSSEINHAKTIQPPMEKENDNPATPMQATLEEVSTQSSTVTSTPSKTRMLRKRRSAKYTD